eukprot:SAG31_NODE_6724_length_1909_cov_3.012707_2_plen_219_part_00
MFELHARHLKIPQKVSKYLKISLFPRWFDQIAACIWSVTTASERGFNRTPVKIGDTEFSELALFVGFLLLTAVTVAACQLLFEVAGLWFSGSVLAREPFGHPLRTRKTLVLPALYYCLFYLISSCFYLPSSELRHDVALQKKFKAQSWQLVIHVTMAVLEARVLAGEPWFEHGKYLEISRNISKRLKTSRTPGLTGLKDSPALQKNKQEMVVLCDASQ